MEESDYSLVHIDFDYLDEKIAGADISPKLDEILRRVLVEYWETFVELRKEERNEYDTKDTTRDGY